MQHQSQSPWHILVSNKCFSFVHACVCVWWNMSRTKQQSDIYSRQTCVNYIIQNMHNSVGIICIHCSANVYTPTHYQESATSSERWYPHANNSYRVLYILYYKVCACPPTAYKDTVIYSGIYTLYLPWTMLYILNKTWTLYLFSGDVYTYQPKHAGVSFICSYWYIPVQ